MKSIINVQAVAAAEVTTLRVVWIEIIRLQLKRLRIHVTTLRVVWIEIVIAEKYGDGDASPPCGWCGLKCVHPSGYGILHGVTTLRVVWIEIQTLCQN